MDSRIVVGGPFACMHYCSAIHLVPDLNSWSLSYVVSWALFAPEGILGVHRRSIPTHIVHIKWLLCVYCTFFWTPSLSWLGQTLFLRHNHPLGLFLYLQCDAPCNTEGFQFRTISCQHRNGTELPSLFCAWQDKPEVSKQCLMECPTTPPPPTTTNGVENCKNTHSDSFCYQVVKYSLCYIYRDNCCESCTGGWFWSLLCSLKLCLWKNNSWYLRPTLQCIIFLRITAFCSHAQYYIPNVLYPG